MTISSERLHNLFQEYEEKIIASIAHCNFTQALQHFLNERAIIIEKEEIVEGEKESYIDQDGIFKYKNTIKLKHHNLKLQVSGYFKKEWEFVLDEILSPHLSIKSERIIHPNNHNLVLVVVLDDENNKRMFAVPVHLAEKLDLEEYNQKQIEQEVKEGILKTIESYEIKSYLSL